MGERLSAEDREVLAAALARKWPDGGFEGMPTRVTAPMCVEQIKPDLEAILDRLVAAAVAEERERIATAIEALPGKLSVSENRRNLVSRHDAVRIARRGDR